MAIDNTDTQVNIRYSVRQRRPWHSAMVLVTGLFLVSGCGRHELEISTTSVDADKILFERGSDALEGEEWRLAREYFIQIRDNFPQSQLRADARLGVADAYTGQGTSQAYDQAGHGIPELLEFLPDPPAGSLRPVHAGPRLLSPDETAGTGSGRNTRGRTGV